MADASPSEVSINEGEITITRVLRAPRELVWQVLTNPEGFDRWWGPEGFTTTTEKYELHVGGVWKHVMHGPDGSDYPNKSVFTEVTPPERLAYRHAGGKAEGGGGVSFESSFTLEVVSECETKVILRNKFPTAEDLQRVIEQYNAAEGGQQTLARLDEYVATLG